MPVRPTLVLQHYLNGLNQRSHQQAVPMKGAML